MARPVVVFFCNDDLLAYKRSQWAEVVMAEDAKISDEEIRHAYRQQHGLPPHAVVTDDQGGFFGLHRQRSSCLA
jgi:hypothetical protein